MTRLDVDRAATELEIVSRDRDVIARVICRQLLRGHTSRVLLNDFREADAAAVRAYQTWADAVARWDEEA